MENLIFTVNHGFVLNEKEKGIHEISFQQGKELGEVVNEAEKDKVL